MPPDSMPRSLKTVRDPVCQPASVKTGSRRSKSAARFTLPDLPREQWCDFRIAYEEGNRTLVQLAEEYMCDPRTVKACILRNKSSSSLGKKSVPTQIDLCKDEIRETLGKRFLICLKLFIPFISSATTCCRFCASKDTKGASALCGTICICIQT